MRYLRYTFYAALMLVLVMLALANREMVTLAVLPEQLAGFLPITFKIPLYIVIMLSMLAGLMVGYVLEYFREHRLRRDGAAKRREVENLTREVKTLKEKSGVEEDDVLALLN